MKTFHSAEIVKTAEGRQYHIGLAPGEVAPYILLCGEGKRAQTIASFFDEAKPPVTNREYITITGKYKGIPVSTMCTGMGCDNTEMALVELSQVVDGPTFIRVGSSGALQKNIKIGDLVISSGSVRLENTSTYFVAEGFPAIAHHEVILSLLQSAENSGTAYHLGLTASASGFYGTQGRTTPFFKPRFPNIPAELEKMNVSNIEMEASTLFSLSTLAGFRAGAVCSIYAQRHENKFIDSDTKEAADLRCVRVALGAVEILARMDGKRGKGGHWLPGMGL